MSGQDVKPEPVAVVVGGEERLLFYDCNALIEVEDRFGSLLEFLKAPLNVKNTAFLIWAGMLWNHRDNNGRPTLAEWEVASWMIGRDYIKLRTEVIAAFHKYLPEPDPKNG